MKDILSLSACVAEYLQTNGVGTLGTDLFIEQLPENPQTGTVIAMTGGPIDPADPTRRVSFQVQHRNPRAEEGLRTATAINNLLNNQWNVIPGFPGRVTAVSEAGTAFKDQPGNFIYPLNYVIVSTTQR